MATAIGLAAEVFGLAAVAALAVSLALVWLARRVVPAGGRECFVLPCAVAIAYFAGYAALPRSVAAFIPETSRPWQWLPYLGLIAAAIAALFPYPPRLVASIVAVAAIAALGCAVLTPDWPIFGVGKQASRWIALAYLFIVGMPLFLLPERMVGRWLALAMSISAALLATVTAALVSVRIAQFAGLATGAFGGAWITGLIAAPHSESPARRLIPLFTILAGGIGWIACVEPDPPNPLLLALPLLPLAIWPLAAAGRRGANSHESAF